MSCVCGMAFLCGSTLVKVSLLQAGTVAIWPQMFQSDVKPKQTKQTKSRVERSLCFWGQKVWWLFLKQNFMLNSKIHFFKKSICPNWLWSSSVTKCPKHYWCIIQNLKKETTLQILEKVQFNHNRARKSRVYILWRYEIHAIIGSLGTVSNQPHFRSHVKSMGDFRLLQITII